MKAALYARVSTAAQDTANQLLELRTFSEARGWPTVEYVDNAISGAKERRPALDRMLADARRRRFDVVVCWRLDRLGRNLRHLVTLIEELPGRHGKYYDVLNPEFSGLLSSLALGVSAHLKPRKSGLSSTPLLG